MYTKKIRYGDSLLEGERSSEADRGRQRGSEGPAEVCGCIGTRHTPLAMLRLWDQ